MEKGSWKKASAELTELFYSVLPQDPSIEQRKMFGYPSAFVNANMFTGLFEESMMVRLPDDQVLKMKAAGATSFEPMPGRVMREYITVPRHILNDPAALKKLVLQAFEFAKSLKKKEAKPAKKKKE